MTNEQYERWKDFALRMAKTCFKHRRKPTWKEILENVNHFFDCLDPEDIPCIVDWDNSNHYSETSPYYSRTHRTSCWHCHGSKKADCPYHCEDGQIYDYAGSMCVGDMCCEKAEYWNPYYWTDSDDEYEKRDEQFCSPVRCCLRAGLDMASAPSAGVMGFTAGDLRKMYPDGVPDWLKDELNGTFAELVL